MASSELEVSILDAEEKVSVGLLLLSNKYFLRIHYTKGIVGVLGVHGEGACASCLSLTGC